MSKIFELTKEKIKGLVILITGLVIPIIINYIILFCAARKMGPEKFSSFLTFWNANILLNLIFIIVYIVWLYLIVSIVLNLKRENEKKEKRNNK